MYPRKMNKLTVLLMTVVLIAATAGVVYAYLSATTGTVTNTFTPDAATQPSISESYSSTEKRNVAVNVGDPGYAVYVRVAIVTTWQKKTSDGDYLVHWKTPEGSQVSGVGDYYLDWNENDWFYHDGYYYLKTMVPEGETPYLIHLCFQQKAAPDAGYQLNVEIVAQTIQALGSTDVGDVPAVTNAWGVDVDKSTNQLTKPSSGS